MDRMMYEKIIEEIVGMIEDNVRIYYCNSDKGLKKLREESKERKGKEKIESERLKEMTKEVLEELKERYLYDFRKLE